MRIEKGKNYLYITEIFCKRCQKILKMEDFIEKNGIGRIGTCFLCKETKSNHSTIKIAKSIKPFEFLDNLRSLCSAIKAYLYMSSFNIEFQLKGIGPNKETEKMINDMMAEYLEKRIIFEKYNLSKSNFEENKEFSSQIKKELLEGIKYLATR